MTTQKSEVVAGFMMTSSNGNTFRVTGPLCGEFTGHRWIPHTKASDVELWCFFDLRLNKRSGKHMMGLGDNWEFGTLRAQSCIFIIWYLITYRLSPRRNGRHFADAISIFKPIFSYKKCCIRIQICLTFVSWDPINNKPTLVPIMARRSVPMMNSNGISIFSNLCFG